MESAFVGKQLVGELSSSVGFAVVELPFILRGIVKLIDSFTVWEPIFPLSLIEALNPIKHPKPTYMPSLPLSLIDIAIEIVEGALAMFLPHIKLPLVPLPIASDQNALAMEAITVPLA